MYLTTRKGHTFQIDDDRPDLVRPGWYLHSSGYIGRELSWKETGGLRKFVFLHHEVLGTSPQRGVHVDHINLDHMDCRRANLRVCTPSQNATNRPLLTSRGTYRGVTWHQGKERWIARATLNYRTHNIGAFETQAEAVAAISAWRAEHMTHSDADRAT